MLNIMSRFINEQLITDPDINQGAINASTLFADLVGFTSITEKLMKTGKGGAEELSILINKVYQPLIDIVYANGGYITSFAGDAITVVFPDDFGQRAMNTATQILDNFRNRRNYYRKHSKNSEINVRIGLSSGEVSWMIFGEERKAYSFYGTPVVKCAEVSLGKEPGTIATTDVFLETLGKSELSEAAVNSSIIQNSLVRIKRSYAKQFVPETILKLGYGGEFRDIVPVFLALEWSRDKSEVRNLIDSILSCVAEFGGYSSSLFYADKGPHFLITFGAPVSFENNSRRAVEFTYCLREKFGNRIKAGITSGTVFAGFLGSRKRSTYTVLGDVVNRAARIMERAPWGQIFTNSSIADSSSSRFEFKQAGSLTGKGDVEEDELFAVDTIISSRSIAKFTGQMVGRQKEMDILLSSSKPLLNGLFGGVVYLYGDAGVGKSRLIAEYTGHLPGKLNSYTLQTDETLRKSFNPFIYFLKKYFHQSETAELHHNLTSFEAAWEGLFQQLSETSKSEKTLQVAKELTRTKSLFFALLGHQTQESLHQNLDAKGRFENTLFALKEFIKALSLITPSIFVLEDIHWLDADSESLLKTITQNVAEFPFMIIALSRYRDDGTKPLLSIDDETSVVEIDLTPLSGETEKELMELRLGGTPEKELIDFINEKSGGNPFYIEQFCCYLIENGMLEFDSGSYRLISSDLEIPKNIKSILVARIDRLSLSLKDLVQKASVIGREFNIQVLSAMLKNESLEIDSLLLEGEEESIWTVLSEISFIFKHALLRDVVYGMQLEKQLQQLHRLAAEAMETLFEGDSTQYADLAYHYRRSGLKEKTLSYLKKAADFARDEYRNQEALRFYEQLASETDRVELKINTDLEIANILVHQGKWDEAESIIEDCTSLALEGKLKESIADCFSKHAKLLHRRGFNERALVCANEAYGYYSSLDNQEGIASTQNVLGNINTILGKFPEALENFALSNKAAERAEDKRTVAMNVSNIGNIYLHQYDFDKAEENYKKALVICHEIDDKLTIATTLGNMAIVCYYRLEYEQCQKLFDEYISISEQIGNKQALAYIYGNIGVLHQELNKFDSAIEHYDRQLQMGYELGDLYNVSIAKRQIGQLHSIRGDFDQALNCLFETRDISDKIGDARSKCMALENIAMVYYRSGDFDKSKENFLESLVIADKVSEKHVSCYTRLHLSKISFKHNDYPASRTYMDEAIKMRRELEDNNELVGSLIFSAEILLYMKEVSLAKKMISEAESISLENEIHHKDEELKLVKALLAAEENTPRGVELLRELVSNVSDEDISARVSFELNQLTGLEEHRVIAMEKYEKLYNEVPLAESLAYLQQLQR